LARSPDFGTFCPEVARCGASPAGVSLSDGHSVFKVQLIDELPQVYTFLTACAVCP
jgi:hypothetical protein